MGRRARHVACDADEIARIESIATSLPSGAHVRIGLRGGDIVSGVVAELPIVQLFDDDAGRQGINAMLRLEDPDVPTFERYLWLDEIDRVEPIDVDAAG